MAFQGSRNGWCSSISSRRRFIAREMHGSAIRPDSPLLPRSTMSVSGRRKPCGLPPGNLASGGAISCGRRRDTAIPGLPKRCSIGRPSSWPVPLEARSTWRPSSRPRCGKAAVRDRVGSVPARSRRTFHGVIAIAPQLPHQTPWVSGRPSRQAMGLVRRHRGRAHHANKCVCSHR